MKSLSGDFSLQNFDILLVRNPTSLVNPAYQRFVRPLAQQVGKRFTPTHVGLLIDTDSVIHSDKKSNDTWWNKVSSTRAIGKLISLAIKRRSLSNTFRDSDDQAAYRLMGTGVRVVTIDDFLAGRKPEDVVLVRHPRLVHPEQGLMAQLFQRALFYLDQPYNPLIELYAGDSSTFCSQLVYQIFRDSGLRLPGRPSNRVLPIDLLDWANSEGWLIADGEAVFAARERQFNELNPVARPDLMGETLDIHRRSVFAQMSAAKTVRSMHKIFRSLDKQMLALQFSLPSPLDLKRVLPNATPVSTSISRVATALVEARSFLIRDFPSDEKISEILEGLAKNAISWKLVEAWPKPISEDDLRTRYRISIEVMARIEAVLGDYRCGVTALETELESDVAAGKNGSPSDQAIAKFEALKFVARWFDQETEPESLKVYLKKIGDEVEKCKKLWEEDRVKLEKIIEIETKKGNLSSQEGWRLSRRICLTVYYMYLCALASDFAIVSFYLKNSPLDGIRSLDQSNISTVLTVCRRLRELMPSFAEKLQPIATGLLRTQKDKGPAVSSDSLQA